MDREDFFYEMAFREIETGELDKATWAKAFSLSTDDEHAKKLYIQYRVEKSKNAPEAGTPDEKGAGYQSQPASRTLGNDQPNLTQEGLDQNKKRSWLTIAVNIILIVTPARLVGDWLFSSSKGYSFDLLEFLMPRLDNGLSWLTMLWPFAFIYWLVKRAKVKGVANITVSYESVTALITLSCVVIWGFYSWSEWGSLAITGFGAVFVAMAALGSRLEDK